MSNPSTRADPIPMPVTEPPATTPRSPMDGGGWVSALRRVPVGVLLLAGALGVLGAGLVLGAAYVLLARHGVGWVPVLVGAGTGPLAIYVALHLVRLTHWSWQAMVISLALLLVSSCWRLVGSPPPPIAPLAEIAVETAFLVYLFRPHVRAAVRRR